MNDNNDSKKVMRGKSNGANVVSDLNVAMEKHFNVSIVWLVY